MMHNIQNTTHSVGVNFTQWFGMLKGYFELCLCNVIEDGYFFFGLKVDELFDLLFRLHEPCKSSHTTE